MAEFGTIWRAAVAALTVWRLSRLLFQDQAKGAASRLLRLKPENFLGDRVMDLLYWLHVWLSAQTAIWVACGFAGVFVSWVAASGVSRAMADRGRILPPCLRDTGEAAGHEPLPSGLRKAAR